MAEIPQNSFQGPLAPKIGLNDDTRSSIPGGGPKIPKKRNYTGLLPVGILALALLILPLTIQQLGKQQNVRQNASGPTPTIVLPTPVVKDTPTPALPPVVPTSPITASPSSTTPIK
jgi:preprotein translocase subunit SecY